MEAYKKLKARKLEEYVYESCYRLLHGAPKYLPKEKKKFHRAPVPEATLEQDAKTGEWIMYGGSGHGAWGRNVTDEEAQAFIKSGEFKAT